MRRDAAASRALEDAVEHVTRTLLRRWGVIFWRLLAREAEWLPRWRDILLCCRRLEARGEIRGGRFVAGFPGEQFASPEAVGLLRDVRRRPPPEQYVSLSGADPLNLIGIVTPGARLPALTGNRLLYLDGLPLATFAAGAVDISETPRTPGRVAGADRAAASVRARKNRPVRTKTSSLRRQPENERAEWIVA